MSEDFAKSKSAFLKALTIEQFNLSDATDAIDSKDIKEMNLCYENLSSAVTDLEGQLSVVLKVAAKDDKVEVDEIKTWRSEQKKSIQEIKEMMHALNHEMKVLQQEEEETRGAHRRHL